MQKIQLANIFLFVSLTNVRQKKIIYESEDCFPYRIRIIQRKRTYIQISNIKDRKFRNPLALSEIVYVWVFTPMSEYKALTSSILKILFFFE